MTDLVCLDISDNGCQRIDIDFRGMTRLTSLIIQDNLHKMERGKLDSVILSDTICDLRSLTHLDLSNSDLWALPREIGRLQNLEVLDINGCMLLTMPACMSRLAKLKTLHARENGFDEIVKDIGDMRSLTHADMLNNNIRSIPASICDLVNLRYLCVSSEEDPVTPIGFEAFLASSPIEYRYY